MLVFLKIYFDWSNNTGAIDVKMDGFVLEEKLSFKMLGLTFSWIGGLTLSLLLKLVIAIVITSKKIGAFILSMKFLSP